MVIYSSALLILGTACQQARWLHYTLLAQKQ